MKTSLASALALTALPSVIGVPVASELWARNNGGGKHPYASVKDPKGNTTYYPTYRAISDFDFESFNLGLYQEYIELDLFNYGLATFSDAEWEDAGVGAEYREIIRFMAQQEQNHAQLITNILGADLAPVGCTYNYTGAFTDVRSYLDFNQRLTKWGESGVIGFLAHLNSRDSANLLHASISTESRQQMVFRQLAGAFPMPVSFEIGMPQAWAWTLLSPYISSCPAKNPKVGWSIYPDLQVVNGPNLQYQDSQAAVSTNRSALIQPSEKISFTWDNPGKKAGPDNAYITSASKKPATHALFLTHINATYTPLEGIDGNSAYTFAPYTSQVFPGSTIGASAESIPYFNGTAFVALVDTPLPVTAYNLSLINPHIVAGPTAIQLG